jgi:hypothetical protein
MWFATGGNSGAWVRILRHRSGGEPEVFETNAVEVHSFPKTPSGGIFSIAFREDLEGVAVGGDYLKPNESVGTAAYSRDSGVTWHPAATTPSGYRSSVAYDPSSKTWLAVGTNGADFSKDDGRNWSPLAGDSATGWNAISFPFVVGGKGKIGKLKAGALGK